MDAATTRNTPKYALLFAALMAAPVAAQAQAVLQVSSSQVSLGSQAVSVTVSSSQGVAAPLSFTVSPDYGNAPAGWFNLTASATTTQTSASGAPTTLTIGLSYAQPSGSQGSITLHDTTNLNDPGQVITVIYTPGGGGGGSGTLNPTPSAVTLTTTPNNSVNVSAPVQITTNSGSTISGSMSLINNTAGAYLNLNTSSFSVSSSSPFNFSVIGSAFTPAGSYSATIQIIPSVGNTLNIPITYTSGSSTSGTPNPVTFNYPNGTLSQSVTLSSSGSQIQATPSSTNGWLLVNNSTGAVTVFSGTSVNLSVNTSVAALLPTGSYSGQVNLLGSDGTQGTVSVTLSVNGGTSGTVTPSPSSVNLTIPSGTTATQLQTVYLNTATSGINWSANAVTNSGSGWLVLSQYSGTLSPGTNVNPLYLYIYPSYLTQGTNSGYVNITFSGTTSGSFQIPVNINLGSCTSNCGGNGGQGGLVAPSSLVFWYQIGGSSQNTSSAILVNSTGNWSASATTSSGGSNWLQVSSSGTAPSQPVNVSVFPGGLAAGSYSGSVSITSPSGTTSVPVTLTVTNSMVATSNPGSYLVPVYNAGDPNPQTGVYVYASDGTSQPVSASTSASWITVNTPSSSPTTVAAYVLTINAAGLPNGLNTGSVTFTVGNSANGTWTLPVAIIVNGSTGGSGPLTFSSSSLSFNANVGGTAPNQTLTVTSTSASTFTVTATSSGWLSVSPSTSGIPGNVTVSVNTAGLTGPGYSGYLSFTANGQTQTVPVSLSISNGASNLSPSPSQLSFSYSVGGSVPAAQTVTVNSVNGSTATFTASASTSSGGQWLSVTPTTQQSTGSTISVSVSPTGLSAGTYNGTITLTNTSNTQTLGIPVTLTVSGAPPITASPTTLTFNYTAGGSNPNSQTISVTGTGSFTATTSSNATWLSVSPSSGSSPNTLTVSVNPAGLAAGTYNGTVTVAGSGGATGSTPVSVTLVVTAPLPTITQVTNAASYASGSISPGELITIFGTAIGPTTPVTLTLTSTGTVSTSIGNVQVLVNGIACPMIYASSTQVSAVVPYQIAIFQTAQVYVNFLGQTSNAVQLTVATTAPGIFTANSSGTGPGAILNQNLSVNSPSNPAAKGSVVTLYMTGEGQTSPAGVTGSVTQATTTPPYTPQPLLPVAALVAGQPATVTFAGEAPGIVAGVLQVNVVIPPGTPSGAQSVSISIGGRSAQNGVTVSVQ